MEAKAIESKTSRFVSHAANHASKLSAAVEQA